MAEASMNSASWPKRGSLKCAAARADTITNTYGILAGGTSVKLKEPENGGGTARPLMATAIFTGTVLFSGSSPDNPRDQTLSPSPFRCRPSNHRTGGESSHSRLSGASRE